MVALPNQPNGLSATTGAVASSSTSAATASSSKPAVQPSEVGWLFVPQYYTFLNQNPGRLHCFYTKKSTLVHGVEQEEEKPCFGQQEIHNKITSLGFQDCKVYVSNVDSQSSASGGIIIQVLGEMSNKAGPWRKFAQTFFLAEQPQGYFVLNDIFRYLKDEEETEEQAEEIEEDIRKDEADARDEGRDVVGAQVDISAISQPGATPHVQPVISASEHSTVAAIGAASTDSKIIEEQPAIENADSTVPQSQVEPTQESGEAAATPVAAEAPAAQSQLEATPAATKEPEQPAAPPKPKTWAGLAASNVSVWGSNVRADAKGVSSSKPSTPAVSTPAPRAATAAQTPRAGNPQASGANGAGGSVNSASVFIKNVQTEHVSESSLRSALERAFGPVTNVSLIASRGIAYADFTSVESAKKAIAQNSLTVGEKGWRVNIEEKKPRTDSKTAQRGGFRGGSTGGRGGGARGGGAGGRGGKVPGGQA